MGCGHRLPRRLGGRHDVRRNRARAPPQPPSGPNAGANLPVPFYNQTPPFTATVHIEKADGTKATRATTIVDPATLPTAYPEDSADAEEGSFRVDFATGDFDVLGACTQVQVVLDNGVIRLKTRDVWEYEVADGPAATVGA